MVSTITAHEDMDPSPRVDIFIDTFDLDGSTETITVWQISAGGEFPVRNAVRKVSAGGFPVTDYEVPLGIPVAYRVQQFNAAGTSIGYVLNMETQLEIADGSVVLQDPLAPNSAVLVQAELGFVSQLTRRRPVKRYQAGTKTIALMGLRGLYEDLPLRVITTSAEEKGLLEVVLAETQLLVRASPSFPIPAVLHVVVPDAVEVPFDYRSGGDSDVWDLTGSEVSRPDVEILVPVITWQRIIDFFPTWTAVMAAYSTWLNLLRNPPPEV